MSGSPHQTRPAGPARLARLLATVGGYVDAFGYVALFQLFTAHQSGNSAGLGAMLSTGQWTPVWRRGTPIIAYTVAVAAGTLLVEVGQRRGVRSPVAPVSLAEVAALAAALGIGEATARSGTIVPTDTASYVAAAACLAGAMGLQTVTLRRVRGRPVHTTFVTGVLSNMAEGFVAAWFLSRRGRRALLSLAGLLGSVWVAYLAGAVAGGAAERAWSFTALVPPMVAVAVVAGWQHRAGYQPMLPTPGLEE